MAIGGVVALAQPALASSGTDGTTGETEPASTVPADTSAVPSPSDAPPATLPVESIVESSVPDTVVSSAPGSVPEPSDAPDDTTVDTTGDTAVEAAVVAAAAPLADGDEIVFVPETVDYGRVEVGDVGEWISVVIAFTTPELEGVQMDLRPSDGLQHSDNGLIGCSMNACYLEVRFAPERVGQHAPTLTITLRDDPDAVLGTLHGSGWGFAAGSLAADPAPVVFGNVEIDTTSPPVEVEIRNAGQASLDLVGSDVVGPFSLTIPAGTACDPASGIPLGAQDRCQVSVSFTPDGHGEADGYFDLEADNGDILRVHLSGYGSQPSPITISPTERDFGAVDVGDESSAQQFVLHNTSDGRVFMSGTITATGPFVVADNDCVRYYEAGDSCRLDVTFAPSQPGAATGTLDAARYASASLTGEGTGEAMPELSIEPEQLDFGHLTVGSPTGPTTLTDTLTVRNAGTSLTTLDGDEFEVTGPFSIDASDCSRQLIGDATCAIEVTFAPTTIGPVTGRVDVKANGHTIVSAQLSGAASRYQVELTPSSVDFGEVATGSQSGPQRITLRNSGGSAMALTGELHVTGPFVLDDTNCAGVFSTGATCWVDILFAPTADGTASGTFEVHADEMTVATAALTGTTGDGGPSPTDPPPTDPPPTDPELSITPASHDFGAVPVGTVSEPFRFELAQPQGSSAGATADGPFEIDLENCNFVDGVTYCDVFVSFAPIAEGPATGSVTYSVEDEEVTAQFFGNGTGTSAPPLSMRPTSHDFGVVPIGSTSAEAAFTVEIPLDAVHSEPRVTGPFAVSRHMCNPEWSEDETTTICAVGVTFQPTAVGPVTGTVTYTIDGVDVSASLSGEGSGGSQFSLDPTTRDFGSVAVGSMSPETIFTIRNDSPLDAMFTPLDLTGPFAVSSLTCSSGLRAGESCQFGLVFVPSEAGPATGNLTITGEGFELTASLSGTGGPAPAPDVSITPTALAFGDVTVGATSAPSTLTITNDGTAPASIDSVSASAPFAIDGSACTTIAANSSCDVSVTFAPTAEGAATGTLTVAGDGFADLTADLSGSGVLPLSVTPTTIDFGSVAIGHEADETITVTNLAASSVPLSIGNVPSPSPSPFVWSTTCATTLAAGASCTVTVAFEPVGEAAVASSITIATPTDGSIQSVDVEFSGTGVVADLEVAAVAFGDVAVGSTGSASATVSNDGSADVRITGVQVDAPFSVVDQSPCVTTLAPGVSCTVDLTFSPTAAGPASGTLTIQHLAGTSTGSVSGRGTAAALEVTSDVDFGDVLAGQSRGMSVTFTNAGNVDLELQPASATGPFQIGDGCTGTLAADATCDLVLQYAPGDGAAGQQTGTLSLTGSAPGLETTGTVALRGFAATAGVTVSPAVHDFGTIALDRYTPTRTTTIVNDGNVAVSVSASLTGGPDFGVDSSACADPLASGSSCELTVTYQPTGAATHTGELSISASMSLATGTHEFSGDSVELTGAAAAVDVRADGPLEFGDVPAGQQSQPQVLTLTNEGPEIGLTGVEVPDGFDIVEDACSGTALASGATCTVGVAVSATADGAVAGDLVVTLDTNDSVQVAVSAVSAVAVSGSLTIAPDAVEFGDIAIDDVAEQQLTITNDLNVPTELTDLLLGASQAGTGAAGYSRPLGLRAAFAQAAPADGPFRLDAGDCVARTLEPGDSCTVTLRFAPTSAGPVDAVLSIESARASATVALSGLAVEAPPSTDSGSPPGTDPGTSPGTDPGNGTDVGSGDDTGTENDGTLPSTGGGAVLPTIALAIGLIGAGALLVTRRRDLS